KGALQRGRIRLRELAREPDETPLPALAKPEHARLSAYVERFNAHDFDAVRAMLAEDVRLDLVNRVQMKGRGNVGQYFHRYDTATHWPCVAGTVDGRAAILMVDPNDPSGPPTYFIVLEWADDGVVTIRDFLFARYAMEGAEIVVFKRES